MIDTGKAESHFLCIHAETKHAPAAELQSQLVMAGVLVTPNRTRTLMGHGELGRKVQRGQGLSKGGTVEEEMALSKMSSIEFREGRGRIFVIVFLISSLSPQLLLHPLFIGTK